MTGSADYLPIDHGPTEGEPLVTENEPDDVMAALTRLIDLQTQHGQIEGAIEFLTGLTSERIAELGGVPRP